MGNKPTQYESILDYYLFQKKIKQNLNDGTIDKKSIDKGYLINPHWIKKWKKMIRYTNIVEFLDDMNFKKEDYKNKEKKALFKDYIQNLEENTSQIIVTSTFMILNKMIFTEKDLEIFVDKETCTQLRIKKILWK